MSYKGNDQKQCGEEERGEEKKTQTTIPGAVTFHQPSKNHVTDAQTLMQFFFRPHHLLSHISQKPSSHYSVFLHDCRVPPLTYSSSCWPRGNALCPELIAVRHTPPRLR